MDQERSPGYWNGYVWDYHKEKN